MTADQIESDRYRWAWLLKRGPFFVRWLIHPVGFATDGTCNGCRYGWRH